MEATGPRRRLQLTDRRPAGQRFRRVLACIESGDFPERRERELVMLLAAAGVLNARLTSYQRSLASRRLRVDLAGWSAPMSGQAGISESVWALGLVTTRELEDLAGSGLDLLDSGGGFEGGSDGGATFGGDDRPG